MGVREITGLERGELIDGILFDEGRNSGWWPPELRFAPAAEIAAAPGAAEAA